MTPETVPDANLNSSKQIVKNFIQRVWNESDHASINEFWDSHYLNHAMPPGLQQGMDNLIESHQMFLTAFSNIEMQIQDQITEDDKVVTRLTFNGHHTGVFMNIEPTNKVVSMNGIRIDRIKNGKIVEHWAVFDVARLIQQLSNN